MTTYVKLVKCNVSSIWEDMCSCNYNELGESYTVATDEDEEMVYADDVVVDKVVEASVVTMIGSAGGEVRCFEETHKVLLDKDGNVFILEDDFEEYFC
jgi:hypothetical protein